MSLTDKLNNLKIDETLDLHPGTSIKLLFSVNAPGGQFNIVTLSYTGPILVRRTASDDVRSPPLATAAQNTTSYSIETSDKRFGIDAYIDAPWTIDSYKGAQASSAHLHAFPHEGILYLTDPRKPKLDEVMGSLKFGTKLNLSNKTEVSLGIVSPQDPLMFMYELLRHTGAVSITEKKSHLSSNAAIYYEIRSFDGKFGMDFWTNMQWSHQLNLKSVPSAATNSIYKPTLLWIVQ